MNVLLDTNALIWAVMRPRELTPQAAALIADQTATVYVSAASAWEIATKVRIGKLPEAVDLERRFFEMVDVAQYTLLSISAEIALRAGRLPAIHKDPFDRMIAAQALALDIPVISSDADLDVFGVRRIW